MRRLILLWVLAALALSAAAEKRLTVAQLEQMLTADAAAHKRDAEMVRKISSVALGERLTKATLARLSARLAPGSRSLVALELLADQSAFLEPPASELPSVAAPDPEALARMLQAARRYVSQTLPRLPDFLATRVIDLYDDSPQALKKGDWPERAGLHQVGTSSGEISIRNERENQPPTQGSAVWQKKIGLISGGEFGNTLGMILSDAPPGSMSWSHWEESPAGRVAVLNYEVPAAASHFEVLSTLRREEIMEGVDAPTGGARGIRGIGARPNVSSTNATMVRTRPGYHGSISINPADGTILRITMDADLTRGAPFQRAAILVEYGPVEIAGSTYICPLRSIALSKDMESPDTVTGDAPSLRLNETHFTHYHRFGSTTRILTESASAGADATPASEPPGEATAAGTAPPAQAALATAGQAAPAVEPAARPETPQPAAASLPASAPGAPLPAQPTPPPAAASAPIAPQPAPPEPVAESGFTLRVEVPELAVPVVVRDRQGHEVGSLSRADFTVLDEGKPAVISGFTVVRSGAADGPAGGRSGAGAAAASSGGAAGPGQSPAQNRFILFLFDDRHLSAPDLAIARNAAVKILDEPLGAGVYADVLSLMGVNSGFTRDRATLQAAIGKLSLHQNNQHLAQECPDVDYYAADRIVNGHDAVEFQVAVMKAKACTHIQIYQPAGSSGGNIYEGMDNPTDTFQRMAAAAAAHALAAGDEDARQTLLAIETVVRAMTKLPGQRTMILVSPGFLSASPDALNFKSKLLDQAAAANVVINAIDARGLYVGNPGASEGANATISQFNGSTSSDHLAAMQASENAMSELAAGTGGTYFHNSNDLAGGLKSLAAPPETLYLLEISLKSVKPNGTYHQLQVKVNQRGLDVQARKGYYAPKAGNGKTPGG